MSGSMEIMAKAISRFSDTVLRKYVLIIYNFDKVLSQDATVTGRDINISERH